MQPPKQILLRGVRPFRAENTANKIPIIRNPIFTEGDVTMAHVFVGMSGGVDSSATALLLL